MDGHIKRPTPFLMKDLNLDISLIACYKESQMDFMGRKTFNTKLYRENIGFGITDISIEINTSLMPSIEITFKDLYGNTLFGTQKGVNDSLDTSVLFAWPPPKFIFAFKGFLGRKVTWLLNLKTTNVNYVSSDGSYEVKCSFVPNQWGFFADIPFLYLIASEKLRTNRMNLKDKPTSIDGGECIHDMESIFSYIRVGKQVEVKTKVISKEFDYLRKQVAALKVNPSNGLYKSNVIAFNEAIEGKVNNIEIPNFTNVILSDDKIDTSKIKQMMKNAEKVNRVNIFLTLNSKVADIDSNGNITGSSYIVPVGKRPKNLEEVLALKSDDSKLQDFIAERQTVMSVLNDNLALIDDEILKRTYNSAKTQIAKLTIGRVLNQIAKDSAFILGLILENGFIGHLENKSRDNPEEDLIGKYFPLVINEKKEEVPALVENSSVGADYGVEKYEMTFVNEFIDAISQGIAENLIDKENISESDKLETRINNAEILKGNPYKPFYGTLAENILVRSGIIGYMTRSNDSNHPGDFGNKFFGYIKNGIDNDSVSEIRDLTKADMSNLSKNILGKLTLSDSNELKEFCSVWDKLFTEDGDIAKANGEKDANYGFGSSMFFKSPSEDVPKYILDIPIVVDEYFSEDIMNISKDTSLHTYATIYNAIKKAETGKNAIIKTPRQIFQSFNRHIDNTKKHDGEEQYDFINANLWHINLSTGDGTYTSKIIKNNGIYYSYPTEDTNTYFYIMFEGNDVPKLKGKMSSKTDIELNSIDEKDRDTSKPLGIVYINDAKEDEDFIKTVNSLIDDKRILDYRSMNHYSTIQEGDSTIIPLEQFVWTEYIKDDDHINGRVPEGLAFMIYSHQDTGNDSTIAWGPFSDNLNKGRNHRVALKEMSKYVLASLTDIELKKAEIIGDVTGKASSYSNVIYKQMHNIFNQWKTIAGTVPNNPCAVNDQTTGLARQIEEKYGGCSKHRTKYEVSVNASFTETSDTVFLYDYPLATVNNDEDKINVKNSIINIEPLYDVGSKTSTLNIIQQICTKNNFIFIPFPGDSLSDNIDEVFMTYSTHNSLDIKNHFHVMFAPTPESRSSLNDDFGKLSDYLEEMKNELQTDAILVEFGGVNNQIFKNISVGTESTKASVESILNLQRLVDKENANKGVKIDCSTLPVLEGRSYYAKIDMIGNSQVYPMQYFFIDKNPLFGGLYQILKVSHSISPNDMTTSMEGIRMRFSHGKGFGGIKPITLEMIENIESSTNSNNNTATDNATTDNNDTNKIPNNSVDSGTGVGTANGNANSDDEDVIPFCEFFKYHEFDSKDEDGSGVGTGKMYMKEATLRKLCKARKAANVPFKVNSGYRTEKHNKDIGGVKNSAHTRGYAIDISSPKGKYHQILKITLEAAGFNRFGFYPNFVHVDDDPDKNANEVW